MADEHKSSSSEQAAEEVASIIAGTSELEVDDERPARREFTAEERVGQAAAAAEEDKMIAREIAALADEQKRVAAQITARVVHFTGNPSNGGEDESQALSTGEETDYTRHDSMQTRVLFVEHGCDLIAPMAAAFVRHSSSRLLSASVASCAAQPPASINPLAVAAMEAVNVPLGQAMRHTLASLPSRSDARFKVLISLDAESEAALAALSPSDLESLGKPGRIHQPFTRATDAASAETLRGEIKTFVEEMPELLSFM